jgi:ribosomal protein S27E
MTTPPNDAPNHDGRLLRLECPHCKAETPLWFRPDGLGEETLSGTEWETWLDSKCRECGKTPREASR